MNTTIIFIRHGLTDWNAERRWQGHLDIPLNEQGIAQALALAKRLKGWPIEALYSSDLNRAAQTAVILGDALGLAPILKQTWRERDVGDFQGLTLENIKSQFPDLFQDMIQGIINPPRGEGNNDLYLRAKSALEELVDNHPGEMVAVVSHGALLHIMLLHVLGLPLMDFGRVSLSGNTGISIVEANNGRLRLTRLNDTAHLE
jgi:2,3-bisphosphoglycerate-dependent phosphoglycerate mutase